MPGRWWIQADGSQAQLQRVRLASHFFTSPASSAAPHPRRSTSNSLRFQVAWPAVRSLVESFCTRPRQIFEAGRACSIMGETCRDAAAD